MRAPRWWVVLFGAVLPVSAWQLVAESALIPAYRLPTPLSIWQAAVDLAQRGLLLTDVTISTQRVLLGIQFKDSQINGRIDRLFLAIVLLVILGKPTDALIALLERHLLRRWS